MIGDHCQRYNANKDDSIESQQLTHSPLIGFSKSLVLVKPVTQSHRELLCYLHTITAQYLLLLQMSRHCCLLLKPQWTRLLLSNIKTKFFTSNFRYTTSFHRLTPLLALKILSVPAVSPLLQVREDNGGRMKAISCLKVPASVKMSEKLLKHTYSRHRRAASKPIKRRAPYVSFCWANGNGLDGVGRRSWCLTESYSCLCMRAVKFLGWNVG